MTTDPVVRSIRVATTLCERFRVILQTGGTGDTSQLELRIGEAQQIYPEIWRHLDEGCAGLVARGVDVQAFTDLRRGELAILGVTNVQETQVDYFALAFGKLRYDQVKSATFNMAGFKRASAACRALMAAMPEVDWQALARAEDREIRAAGSLHTGQYIRLAKWVAIVGGLALVAYGIQKWAMSPRAREVEAEPPPPIVMPNANAPTSRKEAIRSDPEKRQARIRDLTHYQITHPCSPRHVDELIDLLEIDGQLDLAATIRKQQADCPHE